MLLLEHFIYNIVEFDYNILFKFLSPEDKKSFMVWETSFLNIKQNFSVVIYRAPFQKR